jgi:D-alanyl-D-alanine carboxypeptidase/D-alanyl-D-alanine-endopeptidase (penicillin-binding protein 4)
MRRAILALAFAMPLCGANLAESIRQLIDASPVARTAFWGIQVVDLATGKTIYELNPNHNFVPASNTKLFTTALALSRLGPEHKFVTRVLADAAPDATGRIAGGIRFVGGGDPNLSARAIPYRMGAITGNPLGAIEDLAAQLVARGVRRIDGDITGDDTWYTWQPYAIGWGIDDPQSDDGPPISALTLTDNVLTMTVTPGAAIGEPAALSFSPAIEFYQIENRVRTVAAGGARSIRLKRVPGSRYGQLWGTIPLRDRGESLLMSVEDPAEYAARALKVALEERGVSVGGEATSRHLFPDEVANLLQGPADEPAAEIELARRVSAPLLEDLRVTDKVSQNLHAELALRAVGRARRNVGSFEAGREEMKAFLSEIGIDTAAYNLMDGSGLSRLNLVTPRAVVQLLQYMYGTDNRDAWVSFLPVGGLDGTLSARFGQTPVAGKVYAKTGSLSHVSTLSGYIERSGGSWVAFSILVNNYPGPAAGVRGVMDRICNLIWE